jgi:RNA polymerase sigma-70 factor (ECF subfamily)
MQDIFMKLFSNLHKYSFSGSFEGWAASLAKHYIIDEIRKKNRFRFIRDETAIPPVQFEVSEETILTVNNLTVDIIIKEIQHLSPHYRTVFNMYALEDLTHKEIGERLGIAEGTSKSNYCKAKRNLIKSFKKYKK